MASANKNACMAWKRSKCFLLAAIAIVGCDLTAQRQDVADTTTAYSGGFTTTAPENPESNAARLRSETLPGAALTPEEIERLRKPRDYRERPPEEEETPVDTGSYQKQPKEAEEKEKTEPLWKKTWFKNTMIGIALAAVAVLLWFLFAGTLGLGKRRGGPGSGFEDETAPEVDISADYRSLAMRAEQEADWRAALRYRFLELLRDLHLKGWIKLEPGKTNRQYLAEARPFARLDLCLQLTRAYERAWFGRILPEPGAYRSLVAACEEMLRNMERRPL